MSAMAVVLVYVLLSAPLLGVTLFVHALKSDYARLFTIGALLQIIPIGLVFFPLGLPGLGLLAASLIVSARQHHGFRTLGIENPEVARRWRLMYQANLVALGLALEQKGVALLFLDVAARKGFGMLWWLVPASVLAWLVLGLLVLKASRDATRVGP